MIRNSRIRFHALVTLFMASCSTASTANEPTWLTDLESAKQVAATQHKDLLINFTGLEWCGPCVELENDVLSAPEFAAEATYFVFVRLDYPHGDERLPNEPPAPHVSWRTAYGINSFPTVFLADSTGRPYAVTGNIGIDVKDYREHLAKLRAARHQRDDAFATAERATGADKARLLDQGLTAVASGMEFAVDTSRDNPQVKFYRDEIEEVIRLDADNRLQLRDRYKDLLGADERKKETAAFNALLGKTFRQEGIEATLQLLDEKIRVVESTPLRNQLRRTRLTYLEWSDRHDEALEYASDLADDPSFDAEERQNVRSCIAYNLWRVGRIDESIALRDELIAEARNDPRKAIGLIEDKVEMLWYCGRFEEALKIQNEAMELLDVGTVRWLDAQAWRIRLLSRLGRFDEAVSVCDEAAKSRIVTRLVYANLLSQVTHYLDETGTREAALTIAAKLRRILAEAEREDANAPELARIRQSIDKLESQTDLGPDNQSSTPESEQ